ncbi:MAG: hypothetical protein QOJ46_2671 [bacterium]|jgi:hypothetical protein
MVSTFVSTAVVIADGALAALLIAGVAYAARAQRRPAVLWAGGGAIAAWFALALVLARSGFYETTPDTPLPPAIAFGIALPTALGCALLALGAARRAIGRLPLHWLVGAQAYRVAGGLFLVAWAQGDVPAEFALPAGIGDVLVGLAAPFVALHLARAGIDRARPLVLGWCALGILDLVVAVTCGLLTAPSVVQQLALADPNVAITSYPLVLIPTFAVPASIVLHVYVIARLRRQERTAAQPRLA